MEKYYVFSVHHKNGKYKIETFTDKKKLEDHLLNYLKKHDKYSLDTKNMNLTEIANEAEKVGNIIIDEKEGPGIVKVVLGTIL
jgi:hypothetical protein